MSLPLGSIPLGPFRLEDRVGRGGMAEVWRATHGESPVAIKIMTGQGTRSDRFRATFRGEVEAVAALRHPGIVTIFDHGEIDREAESASSGAFEAGAPYLAMELLGGGTLLDHRLTGMSWPTLIAILRSLLAALAHAHARGVIHRDLKSSNVLLDDRAPGGIKLADFGLAYSLDSQERSAQVEEWVTGTPSCMAPEQIQGQWRDYGPWTDLYGFGCLAWELATGKPPFDTGGMLRVARAHLEERLPEFEPRLAVGAGFEGWLRRLLEKDAGRRFVRAADALIALEELPEPERRPRLGLEEPMARRSPPVPGSWRSQSDANAHTPLPGAGLGLYGLRALPFVDREAERDFLWQELADVCARKAARAVVLRGPAGVGKTRLASWIAERSHEAGIATILRAQHGETGTGGGLPRMMSRHLRTVGLKGAEIERRAELLLRARHVLEPAEWKRLADLMALASSPTGGETAAGGPPPVGDERYALIERQLLRLNRQRAVLLVLDDCQWGPDALAFADYLLRRNVEGPLAVLLLITVREDALTEQPEAMARLDGILAQPGARTLELGALRRAEGRLLVRALLGLEGELADTLAERSAGNPLFAVQLVGDWVARGILEPSDRGFALRAGAEVPLPDSLHQIWRQRLKSATRAGDPTAIELAAALGLDVDRDEWQRACAAGGLVVAGDPFEALVRAGLARRHETGWTFAHGMLREALERQSTEEGRWPRLNRACADTLLAGPQDKRGLRERIGRHLLATGSDIGALAALEPLLAGARERRESSEYGAALRLLALREGALDALDALDGSPGAHADARTAGWVMRARIHLHEGRTGDSAHWAARAAEIAPPAVAVEAERLLGDAARRQGRLVDAVARYRASVVAASNRHSTAASLWGLADVERQRGDAAEAARLLESSRAVYEEIADGHGLADVEIGLGDLARGGDTPANAEPRYRSALDSFDRLGNRYGVARCWNGLGDSARLQGRLDLAGSLYLRSAGALHDLGSADEIFPRVNLALLDLMRGDARPAFEALLHHRAQAASLGWYGLLDFVEAGCLAAAASLQSWETAEAALEALLDRGGIRGTFDPDLAAAFESAGRAALAGNRRGLARETLSEAHRQHRALGIDARAQALSVLLSKL